MGHWQEDVPILYSMPPEEIFEERAEVLSIRRRKVETTGSLKRLSTSQRIAIIMATLI